MGLIDKLIDKYINHTSDKDKEKYLKSNGWKKVESFWYNYKSRGDEPFGLDEAVREQKLIDRH